MKALLLLFSNRDEAAAQALGLAKSEWNVIITGPNEAIEVRQDDEFVSKLTAGWAVLASKQQLHSPD